MLETALNVENNNIMLVVISQSKECKNSFTKLFLQRHPFSISSLTIFYGAKAFFFGAVLS